MDENQIFAVLKLTEVGGLGISLYIPNTYMVWR